MLFGFKKGMLGFGSFFFSPGLIRTKFHGSKVVSLEML